MKVLKFGGSSVGSLQSIQSVKKIVEARGEQVIVVVSALGGITDKLIATAKAAAEGGDWQSSCSDIRVRHHSMMKDLSCSQDCKVNVDDLLARLEEICQGIFLLKHLSTSVLDEVVSLGERISSNIVTDIISGAVRKDSLDFIRTVKRSGNNVLDKDNTTRLVLEAFKDAGKVSIVPGFIARSSNDGSITNLGRGGSDYTASILAAVLEADELEIWTDVDGFMTADPRMISGAYVIDQLSYAEAMELCNFGAKVIYPPTLYPVCAKNIPIVIKNTFNPSAPGTRITRECTHDHRSVTGISSINNTSLLTLSGVSMAGVPGVDGRLFNALADAGISVFLVTQSSSETAITLGLRSEDAELAKEVTDKEFKHEIELGFIAPSILEHNLATVAVVGNNMKHSSGVAGRLFGTLGRNGISIIVCAQGSSDNNISIVVGRDNLRKAMDAIHDTFFLSGYQELNLFVCGIGTIGGQLLEQIASQHETLRRERGLNIKIVGIARSTKAIFNRDGIDLNNWREKLEAGDAIDPNKLRDGVIGMNIFNSVFVDCTASAEVSSLYEDFLSNSISVVTANKIAASSSYEHYRKLKDIARRRGVKFLFETNVGAGLPIISTMNDLINSGDRILKIEAVLSGTLNFIFNTISADIPFSQTVRMAKEQGFSEPDPRIDLSGKDVMRKLVILAREAGYKVEQSDVDAHLFVPDEFFNCSLEEFWEKLPSLDAEFEKKRRELEAAGQRWRFVACMDNGKYSVSLRTVDSLHSFYVLDGSNNIILLTTERYHKDPMLIQGYGAGAGVTAAGVFADIMRIANI